MYLKTREYGGASFVDKKSTVIFYQKNFCWIVLEGKKMLFEFFKKNLCGFFVHNSQIGVKGVRHIIKTVVERSHDQSKTIEMINLRST